MTVLLEPELFDSQRFVEVQILPILAHHVPIPGVGPGHRVTEGHYELHRSFSIPVYTPRVILFSRKEHRLFNPGEKNVRMLGKVIVEGRRTRLGGANYKEVRHPTEIRQATSTSTWFPDRRYTACLAPAGFL